MKNPEAQKAMKLAGFQNLKSTTETRRHGEKQSQKQNLTTEATRHSGQAGEKPRTQRKAENRKAKKMNENLREKTRFRITSYYGERVKRKIKSKSKNLTERPQPNQPQISQKGADQNH